MEPLKVTIGYLCEAACPQRMVGYVIIIRWLDRFSGRGHETEEDHERARFYRENWPLLMTIDAE